MAQKKTLNVSIENKIATYQKRCGALVCGNSDYQIKFAFDAEWYNYDTKTARFIYNDQIVDKVFTGDTCDAPVVRDADILAVGVFVGDLITTTPAIIPCKRSIRCKHGAPAAPTPDVYDQIMERLNGMPSTGGGSGSSGLVYVPTVSSSGELSWSIQNELTTPKPVNIRGPKGQTGGQGPAGADGKDGRDGFSPTVSIEELSNGVRVTITDKNGPKSFVIYHGNGGDPGGSGGSGGGEDTTVYHSVTTIADSALTNNTNLRVATGASYSATLTPTSGTLGNVMVRMGGEDITNSCIMANGSGADITIVSVTGDVVIFVGDEYMEEENQGDGYVQVKFLLANVYNTEMVASVWATRGDPFSTTLTAVAPDGDITYTITMDGVDVTSDYTTDDLNQTVHISDGGRGVGGNLVITATA